MERIKIMTEPKEKPTVKLIDTDGNSFAIMGRVKDALVNAGADKEYVKKYLDEAMSGNYDNLLCVTMDYVHVT
jgi:hypothetical protein